MSTVHAVDRPLGVTLFAIYYIVSGSLGVISIPPTLALIDEVRPSLSPVLFGFDLSYLWVLQALAGGVAFVMAFGLLAGMRWVRAAARVLAALTIMIGSGILTSLIMQAVSPAVFMGYVLGLYAYSPIVIYVILVLMGLVAFLVGLALPAVMFQYMTLPYVRAYFEGNSA